MEDPSRKKKRVFFFFFFWVSTFLWMYSSHKIKDPFSSPSLFPRGTGWFWWWDLGVNVGNDNDGSGNIDALKQQISQKGNQEKQPPRVTHEARRILSYGKREQVFGDLTELYRRFQYPPTNEDKTVYYQFFKIMFKIMLQDNGQTDC